MILQLVEEIIIANMNTSFLLECNYDPKGLFRYDEVNHRKKAAQCK